MTDEDQNARATLEVEAILSGVDEDGVYAVLINALGRAIAKEVIRDHDDPEQVADWVRGQVLKCTKANVAEKLQ